MARPPLRSLTGLRFAAAGAVALSHLWYVADHPAVPKLVRRIVAEGPAGVAFFFVLSGFILAVNYHDRFPALTRGRLLPYYAARVGRIWPAHLFVLALAVAFPYLPADGPPDPAKLLAHVFLVQGWVPDPRFAASFNAVAWTLSAEAFFYLVLPGMLWLANRFPDASSQRLLMFAGGVWLVELGYAGVFVGRTDAVGVWLVGICPAARAFEFAVGVLVGLAFVRNEPRPSGSDPRRSLTVAAREFVAVAGLLAMAAYAHKVPALVKANGYYTAMMAVVVWTFAHERGRLSKLFASGPAVFLGEISFAFYLLHCLVFFHAHRLLGVDPLTPVGLAVVSALATLILSAAVYRWVETPSRKWVVRRLGHAADRRVTASRRVNANLRETSDQLKARRAG